MPTTARPAIRVARPEDIDRLVVIENRCFKAHRFNRADFLYHLRNPFSIFFVSDMLQQPIGYIAGIIYHGSQNRIGKLYSMAVSPEWRSHYIGSSLLKAFEKEAKRRGAKSATLEVRKSNHIAREMYFRSGYSIDTVLKDYYRPRRDGLRLRKQFHR